MGKVIGKDYESRKLSQEVRDLALIKARDILKGKIKVSKEFYNALLLKLAGAALPRLNEVTGEGGEPVLFKLINYADITGKVPTEGISDTTD